MEWIEILKYFGITILGGGVGTGIFTYFGKKWVSNLFTKDLKKYEQQLELLKMQKQLQYSNVYTKRAEIISKIYENLANIDMADVIIRAAKFESDEQKNEMFTAYSQIIFESTKYASINGIYLTESIRDRLVVLHAKLAKDVLPNLPNRKKLANENYLKQVSEIPNFDTKLIMADLIAEFQEILGVSENDK